MIIGSVHKKVTYVKMYGGGGGGCERSSPQAAVVNLIGFNISRILCVAMHKYLSPLRSLTSPLLPKPSPLINKYLS